MFTEHTNNNGVSSLGASAAEMVLLRTANEAALILAAVQMPSSTSPDQRYLVYAATAPSGPTDNTLWVDSDDQTARVYDLPSSTWSLIDDDAVGYSMANAMRSYNAVQSLPLSYARTVVVFYVTRAPSASSLNPGDIWIDSDDNDRVYRWDSTRWVDLSTVVYTQEQRVNTFYQDTAPDNPKQGYVWYDTSAGNKMRTWDSVLGEWTIRPFGADAISAAAISTDKLALGVLTTNPVPDPSFEDPDPFGTLANLSWQLDATWAGNTAPMVRKKHGGRSGNYGLKVDTDGVVTRTNLAVNPGFERGLANIGTYNTVAEQSTAWTSAPVPNGGDNTISRKSLKITPNATSADNNTEVTVGFGFGQGLTMGLVPGKVYLFSVDTYWPNPPIGTPFPDRARRMVLSFRAAGNPGYWEQSSTQANATGSSRIYLMTQIQFTSTESVLMLYNGYQSTANVCYFDNLLIEEVTKARPYFDGGSPNVGGAVHSWTGAALTSTSREVVGGVTRTNMFTNPSFENGVANTTTSSAVTVTSSSAWAATGPGQYGTKSALLTPNSTSGDSFLAVDGSDIGIISNGMQAGKTYCISGTFYAPVAQTGLTAGSAVMDGPPLRARAICVFWKKTSGDANYGNAYSAQAAPTGATRVSVTFTLPPTLNSVGIRFMNGYTNSAANICYWDDLVLEEVNVAAEAGSYFDGDSANQNSKLAYNWVDNVGYSASTMGTGMARVNSGVFPVHGMAAISRLSIAYAAVDGNGRAFVRVFAGATADVLSEIITDPPFFIDSLQDASTTIGGTTQVVPTSDSYVQWFADVHWRDSPRDKFAMLQIECDGPGTIWVDDVAAIPQNIGGAAELTAAGLRLFDQDGTEEVALVSNRPNTLSISHGTTTFAYVNAGGNALFQGLSVVSDPVIAGKTLTQILNDRPLGIINITQFGTNWTQQATTEVGMGLLSFNPVGNRIYRIAADGIGWFTQDAVCSCTFRFRYTWGTTMPDINSGIIYEREDHIGLPNAIKNLSLQWYWPSGTSDGTYPLNVILTGSRGAGGGNPKFWTTGNTRPVSLYVEDCGPQRISAWRGSSGGGTGTIPTPPPPTTVQVTSRWVSSSFESYQGSGAGRAGGNGGYVYQGYYSGTQGNQSGAWFFQNGAVQGDGGWTPWNLAGVNSVDRVQIYVKNEHFYYGSGGNIRIVGHNSGYSGSRPGYWAVIGDIGGWAQGEGRWVDLSTNSWKDVFRGFGVGPAPDNGLTWYSYWNQQAQLQITYTRNA